MPRSRGAVENGAPEAIKRTRLIAADAGLVAIDRRLHATPGVALMLIAQLPESGQVDRRACQPGSRLAQQRRALGAMIDRRRPSRQRDNA